MTTPVSTTTETNLVERQHLHDMLRKMLLIRRFEEKTAEMYTETKVRGFLHLYIGEEAVAVGVMQVLTPEDAVVATYREHGQALARGVSGDSIMAEMYGKQEGCSRGRGGSMHLFDAKTRFYGGNAVVASHIPLAAGFALADKMLKRPLVTCCFLGDGAFAEGELHESLNLAVLWKLPVLYVCENNLYCMGTAIEYAHGNTDLSTRAASYGLKASKVDGMDVLAVEAATKEAVDYVRSGNGPYFLEALTYRFRAHSMFDAELYRGKTEVEEWKHRDPITLLTNHMIGQALLSEAEMDAMEKSVASEVQHAVDFAEAAHWESTEELTRFVYSENSTVLKRRQP
jgi:pyruvate dehydrogenase E1 component subunit alpha